VTSVRRRGKYLLVDLDSGLLLIHLGMSGSLSFASHLPAAGIHDHFELLTSRGTLRLNDPRYASLPNIMKAKAKPLALKTPADYGVDVSPRLTVLKTVEPAGRKAGVKVGSVAELIAKLKDEAGVI
jgi:formamidopyrimidine-DNA glycosylase